jgi:hypothetical protein
VIAATNTLLVPTHRPMPVAIAMKVDMAA